MALLGRGRCAPAAAWLAALCSLSSGVALAEEAPKEQLPAEIELFVFEEGIPTEGVTVRFNGQELGSTGADGGLSFSLPAGRGALGLDRAGAELLKLDLLTDSAELVQIIIGLHEGEKPTVDIEHSGTGGTPGEAAAAAEEEASNIDLKKPPGALGGVITSLEEKGPVKGATLYFTGVETEAKTDKEGRFLVELPAGTYSVSVVHPHFAAQTIDNVRVIPEREVTVNLELTPAGVAMQDYVITAPYVEGSVASVMEAQKKASSVSEVLGAEQMSATGDSNAAAALGRVSGLTIDQGKYVLVRGQPYRYTFTLWNGSPLPSPEPLLRVVPLDLFPTGVLSGIEVQKSFTPDKPGEFGAGLIDLKTRGIPSEAFFSFKLSTGGNSGSSFRTGQSYEGGGWDFLGYDDGTRALPDPVDQASQGGKYDIDNLPADEQAALGRSFSNIYHLNDKTLPPDMGVSLAGGGSVDIFADGRLGAVASLQWSDKWRRQERAQRSFSLNGDELVQRDNFIETRTDRNVNLSGLLTVTAEWEHHELSSNTFYAHQAQQRSKYKTGYLGRSLKGDLRQYTLSWLERQLIAEQITGHHELDWLHVDYRGSYSVADRDAPDRREYSYLAEDTGDAKYYLFGNGVSREYDQVQDTVKSFGLDLTFILADEEAPGASLGAKLKTGIFLSGQDRDTNRRIFSFNPDDENGADLAELDPEVLFNPAMTGTWLDLADFSPSNRDDSTGFVNVLAGYLMADLQLWDALRVVGGARYETAVMQVITYRLEPVIVEGSSQAVKGRFTQSELLPALSLTYSLSEELQFKAAYARTTSRPNLNELSNARFFDPDSGEGYVGNPDLKPALIDGADLRGEWYPTATESLSIGGFWKGYTDPIERTFQQVGGSDSFGTYDNAKGATVLGLELSGRMELARFGEMWDLPEFVDKIYLMANAAIMSSTVELEDSGINTSAERPLDGQADYAMNFQAGFEGDDHDVTIAYNLVGRRLHRAGIQGQPDVYLQSVGRLDFSWKWKVWDAELTEGGLRLKGSNLLNPEYVWKQGDKVWRSLRRGMSAGLSLEVKFR